MSDIWSRVHDERRALIADLAGLPAQAWEQPSLAAGWTIHDVAAHLVDNARTTPLRLVVAMAKARLEKNGLVKVLADAGTDRILGVHILGPDAGSLIHEAVAVMQFGAAAEDVARTSHAHPTLPEALREACLAVADRTIHL